MAEPGWIADTDYGFAGLERYLFAPGSPRPPTLSLDGFPVDLGTPLLSAFEGWGGRPGEGGGGWFPDPPAFPAPMGAQDFTRDPVGSGALLTRIAFHGGDPGEVDALAQFGQQGPTSEWAGAFVGRKNGATLLLQQFRGRHAAWPR